MTAVARGGAFDPASVIDGKAWRLTLGLRRLDPSAWLLPDDERDSELAEKARLLHEQPDEVVAELPAGAAAARELLAMVAADPARVPGPVDLATPHPMTAVALLAQEDFCVLTHDPERGQWLLTAACVCFPSRWRLAEKMGRTVTGIHEPVPGYDTIAGPVDAFFDRLTPDRPMWRTNWTILDDPALFQQDGRDRRPATVSDAFFRVERQTLRALPATGAVVFTIRTYRRGLAGIRRDDPAAAHALADTLSGASPEDAAYKGWPDLAGLIRWLRTPSSS